MPFLLLADSVPSPTTIGTEQILGPLGAVVAILGALIYTWVKVVPSRESEVTTKDAEIKRLNEERIRAVEMACTRNTQALIERLTALGEVIRLQGETQSGLLERLLDQSPCCVHCPTDFDSRNQDDNDRRPPLAKGA